MTKIDPMLYADLEWRGVVHTATEELRDVLAATSVTAYIGFDPTASSLHIGSLLQLVTLARLQRAGHRPIAIAGGGTGMIGDPSGKTQERALLSEQQIAEHLAGIKPQLARFLDFDAVSNAARIVNNADWLATFGLLEFLRDTGKHFTVNFMLQKESVNRRLESEEGISYTEFSYLLLQARDFLELFDRYNCTVQLGGSDQWGNITAGIDLIRKLRGRKAHGLVTPLVTTASGVKFGKTESGTVWLDAARTPKQEFRQFWLNTDDRDVITYLKYFTFLDRAQIEELEATTQTAPERREAQRVLADKVSELVHGKEDAERVERANTVLFGTSTLEVDVSEQVTIVERLEAIADDVEAKRLAMAEFSGDGMSLVELVVCAGLANSKSEARRLVEQGGIRVNDRKVSDPNARVTRDQALDGRAFIVQRGPRKRRVILLT